MTQWHYTDNTGSQVGPVPLSELQNLIREGRLPSSAVAWTEGMTEWQPASKISELQSAPPTAPLTPPSPKDPATPAENPYTTPVTQTNDLEDYNFDTSHEYDGIRRLPYFLKSLILTVLLFVIAGGIGFFMSSQPETFLILILLACLVFFIVYIRLAIHRIRNIGLSAWWLFLSFVPVVGSLVSLALLACPEGYAHHKKLDKSGIIILALTIGLFVLSFVATIIAAVIGSV